MIEDFTHALPEDKAAPPAKPCFKDQVFDLKAANEREQYFKRVRQELEAAEQISREKFKALLPVTNSSCRL
ncbi:MAG TPA: hypothetical protein VGE58_08160 [Daejeonella sp.]